MDRYGKQIGDGEDRDGEDKDGCPIVIHLENGIALLCCVRMTLLLSNGQCYPHPCNFWTGGEWHAGYLPCKRAFRTQRHPGVIAYRNDWLLLNYKVVQANRAHLIISLHKKHLSKDAPRCGMQGNIWGASQQDFKLQCLLNRFLGINSKKVKQIKYTPLYTK